jgi:hypothetical protein
MSAGRQLKDAAVRSEKLVAEDGYSFGNPEEGERPLLEAATKQQLVKTVSVLIVMSRVV